ncbi:MAG: GTPase HflX [Myxococcales bacterium]|nr:GTPase HflX [Myxococcales bacterium]MCB9644524.1 GTPase HflX [Myxococcales bacterium]
MHPTSQRPPRALLVGVQQVQESDLQHASSMAELARLVDTLGFNVVGQLSQKRARLCAATIVGAGKLAQIQQHIQYLRSHPDEDGDWDEISFAADEEEEETEVLEEEEETEEELPESDGSVVLIFNNELTPTQMRNLHKETGVEVLDRTGVIIEIFSRHARTREARLQVEIARLAYNAPRIRLTKGLADRQGGGIGAKGAGETAHELDRRRIRDRIAELQRQLKIIAQDESNRRQRRQDAQTVALVGYTNAGKSSLMRALTGSELYVADKLFATLDTTIRVMQPETIPRILVADTVGFIKHLPHDLVASFRSTLDEARFAGLLLHLVDASDPNFQEQLSVTQQVLGEIGAQQPKLIVLNKRDKLTPEAAELLQMAYPEALLISAQNPDDVTRLKERIRTHFEGAMAEDFFHVPYKKSHLLNAIHTQTHVMDTGYDEKGAVLHVRAPLMALERIHEMLQDLQ